MAHSKAPLPAQLYDAILRLGSYPRACYKSWDWSSFADAWWKDFCLCSRLACENNGTNESFQLQTDMTVRWRMVPPQSVSVVA